MLQPKKLELSPSTIYRKMKVWEKDEKKLSSGED